METEYYIPLVILNIFTIIISLYLFFLFIKSKSFHTYPCYNIIIFSLIILLDNILRILPLSDDDNTTETVMEYIQAYLLVLFDKLILATLATQAFIFYLGVVKTKFYYDHEKAIFIIPFIINLLICNAITAIYIVVNDIHRSEKKLYRYRAASGRSVRRRGPRAHPRGDSLCPGYAFLPEKADAPEAETHESQGSYKYDWPRGNRAAPDIRREREGWTYLHNTWGGDFDYDHYIKTDEDGVDHLVITQCLSYLRTEIFCGDRVLGMHRDFPFRWENGLLLNRESAVVADCSDDAADVEIPDWVQSIAWYVFMDKPKLTSISVPTGVTQFWNAFGGCSGVKTVRLKGSPGENPELEEALRQNCPQAEIIYRQRDPQENPSAVTQPRKG